MSEAEKKFLTLTGLTKSFGSGETKQDVLKGIDFSVGKGEFCVLLGPSGSGKSTLLNILGGIDSADGGEITINGDTLSTMNEKGLTQYRRKHLGYVFQMYNLIPNLNVKENIFPRRCQAVSSSVSPSAEPSSRTRTSSSAMSRPVRSTIPPPRRSCSSLRRSTGSTGIPSLW